MGRLPLAGRRILVTRAAHQSRVFTQLLQENGAKTEAVALIEIVAPDSWQPLDQALVQLEQYQYIILTSVNAVAVVHQRLQQLGREDLLAGERLPAATGPVWVCVGPKTAQALQKLGRHPDLQPEEYRAEAIIELLVQRGVTGRRILYPRAQLARPLMPQQLRGAGALVDDPIAYNTLPASDGAEKIMQLVQDKALDVVTFTSSSTVENFVAALGADAVRLTRDLVVASIGPLTSATARRLGLAVTVEARDYTLEGLLAALVAYYQLPANQ